MNRRHFIKLGAAGMAPSSLGSLAADFADTRKRVGLIGTGWYGKCDLLRLIQVAPVEVVSLCDVDQKMLAEAADIVASRQLSKKKPRTYRDYREMLKEKDLEKHCASAIRWHMLDWLKNIASRGRCVADIEQGYISSASCILANLSMQLGRSLAWDPVQDRVIGDEEANRLLRRPYRAPWVHPEPDKV